MMNSLRMDWELTGNTESMFSIVTAAYSLASRFSPKVKAIRSWDVAVSQVYHVTDIEKNFMVIIDSKQ